jgi:ketosteroid isomerase-like protein
MKILIIIALQIMLMSSKAQSGLTMENNLLTGRVLDNPQAKKIVIFGGSPQRRHEIVNLLLPIENLSIYATLSEAEGMKKIEELGQIDIVLIGGRYTPQERERIRNFITEHMPNVDITEPGFQYEYSNSLIFEKIKILTEKLRFSQNVFSQNLKQAQIMPTGMGEKALTAWEKGENSGNYADFKALLSTSFHTFSHPLIGKFEGQEALKKMQDLMTGREKTPNNLTFSEVKFSANETSVTVQFNSKGTVQGKFPYESFNIIVFHFENDKITGFQEYFGFIDPKWFKN